ncbi:MAG TPA: hypothetical protein PLQ67_02465, partial [Burkholderiaceae bacterium]|nr:hypothetical protein [Burkholderiaceae bacterium]
ENVPNGGNQNPDPNDPRNNKLRHTVFAAIGGFTGYHLDGKTLESGVIYEGPNGETRQYLGPAGESAYVHTNDADTRAATTASFAGLAGLFSWNPYTGLAASGISALTYYVTKGAITDNQ